MAKKEYEVKDHQLSITYLHVWLKVLMQNKISSSKYAIVFRTWLFVLFSSPFQLLQRILFYFPIKREDIHTKSPLFILGHWRSGTTHLHYILSKDKQFNYVTNYQAFLIKISLIGRTWLKVLLRPLLPHKRPQDNVKLTTEDPAEDEQPFSNQSAYTGIYIFYFPKRILYHERYHLFRQIKPFQKRRWRRDYIWLLKTISYVNGGGKRLLSKNPHNTSRVKELLEIFPQAKFVFIHRNPYDTYVSMQHHYKKVLSTQFLQDFSQEEIDERILYMYETMMQKYIDERAMIPKENIIEIGFDELDKNPLEITKQIYAHLNLSIEEALCHIETYLSSVKNYEKNKFELAPEIKDKIYQRWKFTFAEWGYER